MPPKRKLPHNNIINDFRKWTEMGAPDPRQTDVAEIKSSISKVDVERARESFWAYRKPTKPQPPANDDAAWPRTDIDRFVLAKFEQAELQPASDAEAYKVLRRLCFVLIGLPPTPEQVDDFTKQWKTDPDQAIEFVVDRLLKKKQFGERWGRHWLDLVRYAESTGHEYNYTYPHAWRYRDYVIDSFNADKPFDRFVQEQIAGDLLPVKSDEQWAENLIATTFLAIGPKNVNERNRAQFEADLIDEQIDATTRVFLSLSVSCARCHDHKFDAIPQTDYYALAGVFRNATTYFSNPPSEFGQFSGLQARRSSSLIILPIDDPNLYDKRFSSSELNDLKEQAEEKMQVLNSLPRTGVLGSNDGRDILRQRIRLTDEMSRLSAKLSVVDEDGKPRSYTMGVQEQGSPMNARLLERGDIDQPRKTAERGFPKVLCSTPVKIKERSSGRLELARFIGSDDHPLTARVMVNRIWQHMIGHGIVRSTENFGVTGQFPSHPELLDYLAVRFVESGWSVKSLAKDIAMSRVYRMSSTFNQDDHEYDSDNVLVWRANPRRLDAEAIRDAMLSVSGELEDERPRGSEVAKAGYTRVQGGSLVNARVRAQRATGQARGEGRMRFNGQAGGRPQFGGGNRPFQRPGQGGFQGRQSFADQRTANQLDMEDAKFRSVYLPVVRDEEPRSLAVCDFADSSAIIGTRESSNTADQELYMLTNRFVIGQRTALAQRIADESSRTREQIERAFVLTYGRPPTSGERSAASKFVRDFG